MFKSDQASVIGAAGQMIDVASQVADALRGRGRHHQLPWSFHDDASTAGDLLSA
jgi:hypothetical protein